MLRQSSKKQKDKGHMSLKEDNVLEAMKVQLERKKQNILVQIPD